MGVMGMWGVVSGLSNAMCVGEWKLSVVGVTCRFVKQCTHWVFVCECVSVLAAWVSGVCEVWFLSLCQMAWM